MKSQCEALQPHKVELHGAVAFALLAEGSRFREEVRERKGRELRVQRWRLPKKL